MTLKELKDYRSVCAELDDVNEQLKSCEVIDCVQSASKFPYSKHSVPVSGLPPDDRVKSLLERQAALKAHIFTVERFVENVDNSEIKKIIYLRYIKGKRKKSWQYIAMQLGYCSEHTPQRKLNKYFVDGGNGGF